MKNLAVLALIFACSSCWKENAAEKAYRETLGSMRDKIMHAKLDCQKALSDSEAGMDQEENVDKIGAAEVKAIKKCIYAFADAEEFVLRGLRVFDEHAKSRHIDVYTKAAEGYLWAVQSYGELWKQRLVCELLPVNDDSLEDDYVCAERAEALEARSNHLWCHAERAYRSIPGGEGGKK